MKTRSFFACSVLGLVGFAAASCAAPPSPPTTSTTTTTVAPLDSDQDGIPDPLDRCPFYADPTGYCGATPYQINDGTWAGGSLVVLVHLQVTSVDAANSHAVAEIINGDPGYVGPTGAAIDLDVSQVSLPAVGDRITVRGQVVASAGVAVNFITNPG
jgi:hypothetical protein